MNLQEWAIKWGVPAPALQELANSTIDPQWTPTGTQTEATALKECRLDAARHGAILWRNNVGACVDERGNHIRYGIANESRQMNKNIKSSDLIGMQPVLVIPEMVGTVIGQFVAREVKKPGWQYTGTEREVAQCRFLELVISKGGDGRFTCGDY